MNTPYPNATSTRCAMSTTPQADSTQSCAGKSHCVAMARGRAPCKPGGAKAATPAAVLLAELAMPQVVEA
jgi:hypothetical protein